MSRHEKLLKRIKASPKDFTWPELCTLMNLLGIELITASGSARKFINPTTGGRFNIHEPHPSNILKPYQVRGTIDFLRQEGFLS